MAFALNYDDALFLDAEDLAEAGIAEAYERLLPNLRQFVKDPARVEEDRDDDTPSYSVRCGDSRYEIYGPDLDGGEAASWGRATVAFFAIVNGQLKRSTHRFYAINGGNDLLGLFLTPAEAAAAQESLRNRKDWPYIPTGGPPRYGQYQ